MTIAAPRPQTPNPFQYHLGATMRRLALLSCFLALPLAASAQYGRMVSNPNFNGSSPAPDANFIANTYKASSSNVITETPYATGSAFGVIKPDGTSCTVTAGVLTCSGGGGGGSGGSAIPSNAQFIFTGISVNDDDQHDLSTAVPITSWSTTAGVTTVTATNTFTAGQWISMRFATSWPAPPVAYALGTNYTLFQVSATGLSGSQFQMASNCSFYGGTMIEAGTIPARVG